MNPVNFDSRQLRKDLEDYYGTAAFSGMPAAFADLGRVQQSSDAELLRIARQNNVDLSRYEKYPWDR